MGAEASGDAGLWVDWALGERPPGWSHQVGLGWAGGFAVGVQSWTAGMGPEEGQGGERGRLGCDGVRGWMQSAESLLPWGQVTAIKTQFLLVRGGAVVMISGALYLDYLS